MILREEPVRCIGKTWRPGVILMGALAMSGFSDGAEGASRSVRPVLSGDSVQEAAAAPMATKPGIDQPIDFDIPAQSLESALERYAAMTGIALIYDSKLTDGLVSRAVQGHYRPEEALQLMLDGVGLTTKQTAPEALVLLPLPGPRKGGGAAAAAGRSYYAGLQRSVGEAFCHNRLLAEGRHRIAMRFWIASQGIVTRTELLAPTGDPSLDQATIAAMRDLAVGAPPQDMVQPFTMLVLPRSSGNAWYCAASVGSHSP